MLINDKPGVYIKECENKIEYISPLKTDMAACISMAESGEDYELVLFSDMQKVIDYYKSGQLVNMIHGYFENYRANNMMNLSQIIVGLKIPEHKNCDLKVIVDKLISADISWVICYDIDLAKSISFIAADTKLAMNVVNYYSTRDKIIMDNKNDVTIVNKNGRLYAGIDPIDSIKHLDIKYRDKLCDVEKGEVMIEKENSNFAENFVQVVIDAAKEGDIVGGQLEIDGVYLKIRNNEGGESMIREDLYTHMKDNGITYMGSNVVHQAINALPSSISVAGGTIGSMQRKGSMILGSVANMVGSSGMVGIAPTTVAYYFSDGNETLDKYYDTLLGEIYKYSNRLSESLDILKDFVKVIGNNSIRETDGINPPKYDEDKIQLLLGDFGNVKALLRAQFDVDVMSRKFIENLISLLRTAEILKNENKDGVNVED